MYCTRIVLLVIRFSLDWSAVGFRQMYASIVYAHKIVDIIANTVHTLICMFAMYLWLYWAYYMLTGYTLFCIRFFKLRCAD